MCRILEQNVRQGRNDPAKCTAGSGRAAAITQYVLPDFLRETLEKACRSWYSSGRCLSASGGSFRTDRSGKKGKWQKKGDNMQRIAKFEKVSFEQFKKDWQGEHPQDTESTIKEIYDAIRLPKRATAGSAGYDFYAPAAFTLKPGETTKILTGIRARIDDGWVLKLYPRSGLGFKFRLQLNNTVGIIDSDYYGSDNEGHIQVKLTNDSKEGKEVSVEAGTGFSQGIFVEYGITVDDDACEVRNGGFGSTTKA